MTEHLIKNKALELHTTSFGASMTALYFKDRNNTPLNMIYGYAREDRYLGNPFFMGATCGRYAGRIGNNGFELEGNHYTLESDGDVHLHGGKATLAFREWRLKEINHGKEPFITYGISSEHLDGGYPGNLEVEARYTLRDNTLEILYSATSDSPTHLNLTNHNYYNLNGGGSILDHFLQVSADGRLETDNLKIPTGDTLKVTDSSYDFNTPQPLDGILNKIALDDVFTLSEANRSASLYAPGSGVAMKLTTNQPGLVIFIPEQLDHGPYRNPDPKIFPAICLEPQNFPDAPNKAHFPASLLKKGEIYENRTILEFNLE